jgi:solute:Na+ symporter, SSS family
MTFLGLHWLDVLVVLTFLGIVLWLGVRASRVTKTTEDFYVAGRRLGKTVQFFLNFGTSTNADQAIVISREVYRQGIGGCGSSILFSF